VMSTRAVSTPRATRLRVSTPTCTCVHAPESSQRQWLRSSGPVRSDGVLSFVFEIVLDCFIHAHSLRNTGCNLPGSSHLQAHAVASECLGGPCLCDLVLPAEMCLFCSAHADKQSCSFSPPGHIHTLMRNGAVLAVVLKIGLCQRRSERPIAPPVGALLLLDDHHPGPAVADPANCGSQDSRVFVLEPLYAHFPPSTHCI
jgi:hypothetical protein